jgi:2-polyprenyl-3-methyl-5-hydroxy-6-metoxy-1,4-benzoquinol methylase
MERYKDVNIENTKKLLKNITPKRYNQLIKNRYSLILNMIEPYANKKQAVLDVGTRDGALLDYLKENGFDDLHCIDICLESIKIATSKGYDAWIMDAQNMTYDREFGTIIMSHVLEHCPDINRVINGAYRGLKKNGILFVEVPRQDPQKVPNKDAHYHFFPSLKNLIDTFKKDGRWEILDSFKNKENTRLKIVLRKKNGE